LARSGLLFQIACIGSLDQVGSISCFGSLLFHWCYPLAVARSRVAISIGCCGSLLRCVFVWLYGSLALVGSIRSLWLARVLWFDHFLRLATEIVSILKFGPLRVDVSILGIGSLRFGGSILGFGSLSLVGSIVGQRLALQYCFDLVALARSLLMVLSSSLGSLTLLGSIRYKGSLSLVGSIAAVWLAPR
jgi:hypothetical protein